MQFKELNTLNKPLPFIVRKELLNKMFSNPYYIFKGIDYSIIRHGLCSKKHRRNSTIDNNHTFIYKYHNEDMYFKAYHTVGITLDKRTSHIYIHSERGLRGTDCVSFIPLITFTDFCEVLR